MPNDLTTESPRFLVKDIPKQPCIASRRNGSRMDQKTGFRWAFKGLEGVILETILIGGLRYTSGPALARFFAAVTAARARRKGTPATPAPPPRDSAAVESELDRLGL